MNEIFLEIRGRFIEGSMLLVAEDGWELRNVTFLLYLASLGVVV